VIATLLGAAMLLVAACSPPPVTPGPSAPSGAPSSSTGPASATPGVPASASTEPSGPSLEEVSREIATQVETIRELPQLSEVERRVVDAAAMRAEVEAELDKETPPGSLDPDERLAKVLGLLPPHASLDALYRELLGSQVVGLYAPDRKALYVLQPAGGRLGPSARMIYAHEFTHALQDQHFDLTTYGDSSNDPEQGDRGLARISLVEGDAQVVMLAWAQTRLSVEELLQAARESADPASQAILAAMPAYLRETTLFPYTAGSTFVTALQSAGGWAAVDAAYADPPTTTEQVMHTDKYTSREAAIPVEVPANLASRMGSGWSVGREDTLGEFILQVWLRGSGDPSAGALKAAAGWGGDRIVLLDGPDGQRGAALLTAWDSVEDAREFVDQARVAIDALGLNAALSHQPASTAVTVVIGSDDGVTDRLYRLLGAFGV
jgi:hypothetical protein